MLHVAPEQVLASLFRSAIGAGYLSGDLCSPLAMEHLDITGIHKPDNSFDIIYCSHVLEHVPDDRKAMSELFRVLKSGGWAILNVPISADSTFEDPSVTDPKDREALFGQSDHVRRYGPDYVQRLEDAGFSVDRVTAEDIVPPGQQKRFGLLGPGTGEIYYCTKAPD